MSILRSLLRFIDPIEHRQKARDERRKREVTPAAPATQRVCRVCGYAGEGRYCPACLAETMEPQRRR